MASSRRADTTPSRPRPRPTPHGAGSTDTPTSSRAQDEHTPGVEVLSPASATAHSPANGSGSPDARTRADATPSRIASTTPSRRASTTPPRGRNRRKGRELARTDPAQSGQVVAAAGNAIVTAARVGRLLGRSGWRIAKQLPGVNVVEQQAQKIRHTASAEMFRLLEMPQQMFTPASAEEQRVMMLVQDADSDPAPLRTAMTELLERSTEANDAKSRDYLFGTIVSQLVPDEARILAALGDRRRFAVVDVVAKQVGRATTRPVLVNASTVGAAAGVSLPQNVSTYLTRLHGYGLVEFGLADDSLEGQFEALLTDPVVQAARTSIDSGKQGSSKVLRKSVSLSPLGAEFWDACAPTPSMLNRGAD